MNKSIKRTMGLVLALLVAVSMCIEVTGVFADETNTNTNDQNVKAEAKEAQKTQEFKEESKDEPAETVESKSLKETKASEDKLEISEETKAKDNAVNEGSKTQDVYLLWHHSGKDKGWYNPEDEGKEISFEYVLKFSGKDKNGQTKYNLSTDYRNYNGKIGQELKISVPVDEMESKDGEKYTDCKIERIDVPINTGNRIYGAGATRKDKDVAVNITQNMETMTKRVIAPGAIILDDDKENMKVRFTLAEWKDGNETYPVVNRRRPLDLEIDFTEGESALVIDSRTFYRAAFANDLSIFSPFTGKFRDFKLHADFSGDNKDELNKKYNLDVSGDDINGWTVTLSSKIKKGEKEEIKDESNYKTIYKNDPTLLKGKTKIIQEGAKGFTRVKTAYYYIQDENGKEEILKEDEPVTEIVNPTDKIVLVGTKIASEDGKKPGKDNKDGIKPGNNNNAKTAPKTGDSSDMMMYAGLAVLVSMSALLVLKRKRSYK